MATKHSEQDGDPSIGGDRTASGQMADPVATKGKAQAQAGGPLAGEPAAGGTGYASGGQNGPGGPDPSGRRTGSPDIPASNEVAPPVRTAMDDDVRATEEKARSTTGSTRRNE